ncbi:hypothetical protein HDU89_003842 [Geranomyces variabilis]|nr:hypothetical protein HDU89_003842 [Geranomyces variabilis]
MGALKNFINSLTSPAPSDNRPLGSHPAGQQYFSPNAPPAQYYSSPSSSSANPPVISFPPIPVPARGFYLEDGFVADMPAPLFQLNTVPPNDWAQFLRDVTGCARRAAAKAGKNSPRTAGWLDAQAVVGRWNMEYFAPRGLNVALVGVHVDHHTGKQHRSKHRSGKKSSSSSSSDSSSSSSENEKGMMASSSDVYMTRRGARRAARAARRERKARRREERRARRRGKRSHGAATGPGGGPVGGSEPIRLVVSCTAPMYLHPPSGSAGGQSMRSVDPKAAPVAQLELPQYPQTQYRVEMPMPTHNPLADNGSQQPKPFLPQLKDGERHAGGLPPPPYSPFDDQEDIALSSAPREPRQPPSDEKDPTLFQ